MQQKTVLATECSPWLLSDRDSVDRKAEEIHGQVIHMEHRPTGQLIGYLVQELPSGRKIDRLGRTVLDN